MHVLWADEWSSIFSEVTFDAHNEVHAVPLQLHYRVQ